MRLVQWALRLKRDVHAVWLAARDPRVPWLAKAVGALVAAYALSPIDLVPDFIPVLGVLDELVVLPAGLWLAVRLVPAAIMAEHRAAAAAAAGRPRSWIAAAVFVGIWIASAALAGWLAYRYLFSR